MKKWAVGVGFASIVIFVGILMLGISNLGPVIRTAINNYGPSLTGTEVRLGAVDISIFSAAAEIKEFLLGNPKGFKSSHAMRVGSIHVEMDEKSITGDTIVIDRIEVVAPDITYEKKRGTDNFKAILGHVNGVTKAGNSDSKPGANSGREAENGKAGKKLMIREFVLTGGKVRLATGIPGTEEIIAELPEIRLQNIGGQGGATAAQVFQQVLSALHAKLTSPAVAGMLDGQLRSLTEKGKAVRNRVARELEKAGENGAKELGEAADKLKSFLNN